VRFYVPEWEDHVDADYDFNTDEHSSFSRKDRNLAYIWDIFDRDPALTPIDGVLISREQIEESANRLQRLRTHGVHGVETDGTTLAIPDWLTTISDCGAWGYKDLPFPPYGNEEMLDFYEDLDVDVGVTIDHLVLGSGQDARLYLNERDLPGISRDDLPDEITDTVDVMIAEWPTEWPEYVREHEPSITVPGPVQVPRQGLFDIDLDALGAEEDKEKIERRVKEHLRSYKDDPRLVFREDDTQFRYDLTLENLREMRGHYDQGDYSFRLMCAIQGWDTASYAQATRVALSEEYDYIGIGGVAGSSEKAVKRYVSAVGEVVHDFEQAHETRVDTHVFGFAKTGAFETIGRSGMSSFDSASMLRSAWTGGKNYHLDTGETERRYDALRVRYPSHSGELSDAINMALWSQEVLTALRAYDEGEPLIDNIKDWHKSAKQSLSHLEEHIEEARWSEPYNQWQIRDLQMAFRAEYPSGGDLKANFSNRFRKRIIKLLREDTREDPVALDEYTQLIKTAEDCLDQFPKTVDQIEREFRNGAKASSFEAVWSVVEAYTNVADDEQHRDGYRVLLEDRPWELCDCPICSDLGIEVVIFRGNNRNRRRGFHNTRRFYDQFKRDLPKVLVLTKGDTSLSAVDSVEEFLSTEREDFWRYVHDLPVVEVAVGTAEGIHEWWEEPPLTLSFAPSSLRTTLREHCTRYQDVFVDGNQWDVPDEIRGSLEESGCDLHVFKSSNRLRSAVLERLSYDERTLPPHPEREEPNQIGVTDFKR
jgi:hypothetical protein